MFDIGFWELSIIGVVALLVIGPERLPGVARTVGLWVGKARNFVSTVQADVKQELGRTEDLKKLLEEQTNLKDMHEIIEQTVDEAKKTVAVGNDQFQRTTHKIRSMDDVTEKTLDYTDSDDTQVSPTDTAKPEKAPTPSTDTVNDTTK